MFGGNQLRLLVDLVVTATDIENSRNFLYFSPFISSKSGSLHVNWGDGDQNEYVYQDMISHVYATAGNYTIEFTNNIDSISLNAFRQTTIPVKLDNTFDNTIRAVGTECTLVDNVNAEHQANIQVIADSIISKDILEKSPVNVKFGNSVSEIAYGCFKGNSDLYKITFSKQPGGKSRLVIHDEAFANCIHLLGNICLPENCIEIGADAFANCHSIYSITIPKSCTKIGKGAFFNCPSLTYLTFKDRTSTEVKDFIDANTENGNMVWFAANNIPKILIDATTNVKINQEFADYIETLPIGTSDLVKSYMFRKHILNKFKTYDFSENGFVYLKYLTNTTPEYINLYDYSSLYYSMSIINTIVEENSKEKLFFAKAKFTASSKPKNCMDRPFSCTIGNTSDGDCGEFTCSGSGATNTCTSYNSCNHKFPCEYAWSNGCYGINQCVDGASNTCSNSSRHRCVSTNICSSGTNNGCVEGSRNINDWTVCNDFSCSDFYRDGGNPDDTNNMSGNIGVAEVGTGSGGYSGTTILV